MTTTPPPRHRVVAKRFLAGTCSGAALVVVGHPLDTLKVLMQTAPKGSGGLWAVSRDLARREGVRGFYRGMSTPLALTGFINTLLWGMQFNLVEAISATPQTPATLEVMQAAVVSGALISVVVTPIELVKSRLQVGVDPQGERTPFRVVRNVLRQDGVAGLYRGWLGVVLARASNWAYFGGYAFFAGRIADAFPASSTRTRAICAGGLAGFTYWLAAYPFDVVKARMMVQAVAGSEPRRRRGTGFVQATRGVMQEHGLWGFTRGFLPCVLRAFPANAAAFLGFESAMEALNKVM